MSNNHTAARVGVFALVAAGLALIRYRHNPRNQNHCLQLIKRPGVDEAVANEDFKYVGCPWPVITDGQIMVQTLYLSVDPYMRCRFNEETNADYLTPFPLGSPPTSAGIGRVVDSRHPDFKIGDMVESMFGFSWQLYSCIDVEGSSLRILNPSLSVPLSAYLGLLGMPGLTSYFCMLDHGKPEAGETVVVSACAGACGSVAGQLAKIKGARVVGICGSVSKAQYCVDQLGFDAAVCYRDADWSKTLASHCPNGVDVYFDNVGGEISDTVIELINQGGRIPVCGQIADYNKSRTAAEGEEEVYPPLLSPHLQTLIEERGAVRGRFLVLWYAERFSEGLTQLASLVADGSLKVQETRTQGLVNAGVAFVDMMKGGNVGKAVVEVAAMN